MNTAGRHEKDIMNQELIDRLISEGLGGLVDVLFDNGVYTKKGKLSKSKAARAMGISVNYFKQIMLEARMIIDDTYPKQVATDSDI